MAKATGTMALTTAAAQMPAAPFTWASIRNNDAAIAMLIGWNSTTQSYTLPAGQQLTVDKAGNLNEMWIKSASGTPTMSYITK